MTKKLNDSSVEDKQLISFLLNDCETIEKKENNNDFFKSIYIGRMNYTFEITNKGILIEKPIDFVRMRLYLNAHCFKGQRYNSISLNEQEKIEFFVYLQDLSGEYVIGKLEKSSSTVS